MSRHLVKVRRYGGGESVVDSLVSAESAHDRAEYFNALYQTDTYYAEPYDRAKVQGFGPLEETK